ncbi:MAG: HD domain-containing phosphohydrolase [Gemmatimonadota bacterium]
MTAAAPAPTWLGALLEQGRLAEARGQVQAARELYERALHSLTVDTPAWSIARLLLGVGRTHLATRNSGAALDCVEAVFALPTEAGMEMGIAEALELRGCIRWLDGQVGDAREDFVEVRRRATESGRPGLAALGASHLADLAILGGQLAEAITLGESALEGFRTVGDEDGVASAAARLAGCFADLKRWNAAEQAFADAAAAATGQHNERLLASIELGRAEMALDRANVERAQAAADRALELARRVDDRSLLARALVLAGIVARELGDLPRAERLLEQADRLAEGEEDLLLIAETARELADLLARSDRHASALRALNRAYRALAQLRVRGVDGNAARRMRRLDEGFFDVVRRLAQRIEGKDHATGGHCDRVADLTCEIARRMGIERQALRWYRVGAYLHDIGKLEIPPTILNKSGRLSPEEWAIVKRHPVAGADMLRDIDFPWEVRPIVESHHECWDGSGYPHGLAGEEIPLAARIFTVADVYDALVSRRSFKVAVPHDEALDVMRRDVGRQFDPAVFKVFAEVVQEGIAIPGVTSPASMTPQAEPRDPPILDDVLTSVADRASWTRRAARLLAARRDVEQPVALLLLDVDHFTRVNAAYGRLQGDDLLWAIAKVLQRGLRTGDLIGRRGGDEFLVLLPSTTPEVALDIAERLRDSCARLRCARRDAPDEEISISVSIALAGAPADGETIESLVAAADRALYRAKRDGRDRVVVADHADTTTVRAQLDFAAFVAREEELRTIVGQLDLANRADARLVFVDGEEGIGKTALVRHLEPEIRLRTGTLITAQCLDGDQSSPYAPWTDVIARLHAAGHIALDEWRALPRLVPGLPAPRDGDDWALTPSLLQEEIVRAVRRVARERLLVLVFEDMQWADAASWAVLDALLAALDGERLFLVLTLRPEEARAAADWRRRLTQHARTTHLSLRRFSVEELRRWTQVVFRDADPGDEFPRVLHGYTEGIPLHVVQVLHALAEGGGIWYGGTRWEWRPLSGAALPPGVAFVLERRLHRLSPAARSILATAAVLGSPFSVELLLATANVAAGQVTAALDEGEAAAVVSVSRDGEYIFSHERLAEAVIREVPERQRQRLHEITARLLELRAPSSVEVITGHYHAAGLDPEAFRYARLAAERSASVFAHDAALEALQLAQRYAPSARDLATLRVQLATRAFDAGRYASAETWCDLALEWLRSDSQAGDAPLAVRELRERARVHRGKSPLRSLEALRAMLANDEPTGTGSEVHAAVQLAAATLAIEVADWPLATSLVERALASLGRRATAAQQADAQGLLAAARYGTAPAEALALARDAAARGIGSGDRLVAGRTRLALGDLYVRAGHLAHADEALGEALDAARGAHSAPLAAAVSRALAELRGRQGVFGEAMQWLGDAERIFSALGDPPERLRTTLLAAHVARDLGDRAQAHALYDVATGEARALDLGWIELTALAGAALTNGGPEAASTAARWERANQLIATAAPDWWFPGRELVDALSVHLALSAGHSGAAFDLFARALQRFETVDPYAGAWLVAECADGLERIGFPAIAVTRRIARERAQAHAFLPLLARLGSETAR